MKLLVAGIYPPDVGGPATYAVLLERELPKRGIEVAIAPFAAVRHLPPLIRHIAYCMQLVRGLRDADVLFVQDTVSSGLPAVAAAWLSRKPLVLRIGGDYAWEQGTQRFGVADPIEEFQTKRYGLRVEILRSIQKFVVRRAAAVIAPSRYLGTIVQGWMQHGHAPRVIYNGIELPLIVRPLATRPAGVLVVSAGRLVPWKGMDELIDVIARHSEWTLALVGDGPERAHLEQHAEAAGCTARVIFTGTLPREEMLGWCAAADIFVLNSSYEGLSHVLIEVQSLGTPTIATRIGGNEEVIEDGVNGILVAPHSPELLDEAISNLLADRTQARDLGTHAKMKVRDFTVGRTMDMLKELLLNL